MRQENLPDRIIFQDDESLALYAAQLDKSNRTSLNASDSMIKSAYTKV